MRIAATGLEHTTKPAEKTLVPEKSGTDSGTLPDDPDLVTLISIWPNLKPKQRRQLVALVQSMVDSVHGIAG
jgi:hypothetical protein